MTMSVPGTDRQAVHRRIPSGRAPLLIGGGVGIPPMVFLAERLRERSAAPWKPLVLMGSEMPFPFRARPSTIIVPGMPAGTIACMPLLEEWGIAEPPREPGGLPGLLRRVRDRSSRTRGSRRSSREELAQVEIFACGPTPMLKATAALARRYRLPCQVSLEEFMACAVGGCAGCTVQVRTPEGPAMKRVCVDGPVFDAYTVF